MAEFKSFLSFAKTLNNSVSSGTRQAANESLKLAQVFLSKNLQGYSGLPKRYIDQRTRTFKATKEIPQVKIHVDVKRAMNLASTYEASMDRKSANLGDNVLNFVFQIKEKNMRVRVKSYTRAGKNGPIKVKNSSRTYYGVTAKIGNQSRELVSGAFARVVKNGRLLVLRRKGDNKYPTQGVLTDVFYRAARVIEKPTADYMKAMFDSMYMDYINDAIEKKYDGSIK